MQLEKNVYNYYARQFSGGKSRLGRALDFVMLRVTAFFTCYAFLLLNIRNIPLSAGLALLATIFLSVAIHLYQSIRLDKFIEKQTAELYAMEIQERLMLLPPGMIRGVLLTHLGVEKSHSSKCAYGFTTDGAYVAILQRHPSDSISADLTLCVYKDAQAKKKKLCEVYATTGYSPEAVSLAEKLTDVEMRLHAPTELVEIARQSSVAPTEDAVATAVAAEIEKQRRRRITGSNAFLPGSAKKYFTAALLVGAMGFVTGYRAYYALICSLCVCCGIVSWWLNRERSSKRHGRGEEHMPM